MSAASRHSERFVTVTTSAATSGSASMGVSASNGIAVLQAVAVDAVTYGGSATSVRVRVLREAGETSPPSCRFDMTFEGIGPHLCLLPVPVTVALNDGSCTIQCDFNASGTHSVGVTCSWELTIGARRSGS